MVGARAVIRVGRRRLLFKNAVALSGGGMPSVNRTSALSFSVSTHVLSKCWAVSWVAHLGHRSCVPRQKHAELETSLRRTHWAGRLRRRALVHSWMRPRDAPSNSMVRADLDAQRVASKGSHRSSSCSSLLRIASLTHCRDACIMGRCARLSLTNGEAQSLVRRESTSSFDATPLWPGQKETRTGAPGLEVQNLLISSARRPSAALCGVQFCSRRRALWQSVSTHKASTRGILHACVKAR